MSNKPNHDICDQGKVDNGNHDTFEPCKVDDVLTLSQPILTMDSFGYFYSKKNELYFFQEPSHNECNDVNKGLFICSLKGVHYDDAFTSDDKTTCWFNLTAMVLGNNDNHMLCEIENYCIIICSLSPVLRQIFPNTRFFKLNKFFKMLFTTSKLHIEFSSAGDNQSLQASQVYIVFRRKKISCMQMGLYII